MAMRRTLALLLTLAAAAPFAASAALADFRMCNLTDRRVSVALAYTDG